MQRGVDYIGVGVGAVIVNKEEGSFREEEKQHWVSPAFVCKVKSGEPKILEPGKSDQIGWFTLEDISKIRVGELRKKYPDGLPNFY